MITRSDKWKKIAGYLANEMNEKQKQEFLHEMQDNQLLKNDYELMKNRWNQFDASPDAKYMDTSNAWKSLKYRIEEDGMLEGETPSRAFRQSGYFLRIAAAIVIILAVGIPSIYFSLNNGPGKSVIEHSSLEGVSAVDLPDGSRVFLNKGSVMNYRKSFDENREINLKGEGYFDVMSDPKRPFRVNSGKVVVTVLGTSFNVKESEANNVEVFVESGLVQVSMNDLKESILLKPGEIATAADILTSKNLENENYLSWKTKDFKFVDESIENILKVLKESYHVEVVTDNVPLQDMRLTTTYNNQSFDAILSTICLALNMNYEKEGKVYILQSK